MNFEGHYKLDLSPELSVVSVVSAVTASVAVTQPRQEAIAVAIAISPVSPAMMSSIAAMIAPIAAMMAPIAAIGEVAIGVMTIRMVTIPRMASVQVMDVIASTEAWPKLGFSQYLN